MVDQDGFTTNYQYDAGGRLQKLTDGNGANIITYTYDSIGRLAREDNGNGTYTTYSYDVVGQLRNIVNYQANNTINSRFDYTYDSLGRRNSSTTIEGKTTYSYDATGQLTSVVMPDNRTISYEYDAAGNRISVIDSGATTAYDTNSLNQHTNVGGATYAYDADGNLIAKNQGSQIWTYNYDTTNRLVGVVSPEGTWRYEYDALGNRIASIKDGQRTEYLLDPTGLGDVVGEYSSGNVARYTYGLGLVSRVDGSNPPSFYDTDAIGSVVGLSGSSGNYLNSYSYLPFGEDLTKTETIANPFEYVGQYGVMDEGNGLDFMRARFYTPVEGRFMNPDPIGINGGINLYQYSENNPVSYIDPIGLRTFGIGFNVSGGVLVGGTAQFDAVWDGSSIVPRLLRTEGAGGHLGAGASVGGQVTYTDADNVDDLLGKGQQTGFSSTVKGTKVNTTVEYVSNAPGAKKPYSGASVGIGKDLPFLFSRPWDIHRYDTNTVDLIDLIRNPHVNPDRPYPPRDQLIPDRGSKSTKDATKNNLPPGENKATSQTSIVFSSDPNDIIGPSGFGDQNWLTPAQILPYTIRFENQATATAAAVFVTITHTLDADLDLTTFELGDFGFGDLYIDIPQGFQSYTTRLDLRDTIGDYVDFAATLNPTTRTVTWTLTTIDPATGQIPDDVDAGFLPPNNANHDGEGFVNYQIKAKSNLTTGAVINAEASIVFDTNEPINTPPIFNTIDIGQPDSAVINLPGTDGETFTVTWGGSDDGSGIASYDIFVAVNGGAFTLWQDDITATSAIYNGEVGKNYAFYSVAKDNVGYTEDFPLIADTTVTVVASNNLPVLSAFNKSGNEDAAIGFRAADFTNAFSDADGNTLMKIQIATLPANGILKLNGDNISPNQEIAVAELSTLSFTPNPNFNGNLSFAWNGFDGTAYANTAETVNLAIAPVNDAPIVQTKIADQYATEVTPFSFIVPVSTFSDVDLGDTLTYSATLADGSALPDWLGFNSTTRTFSGNPTNDAASKYNIAVTATDTAGSQASDSFSLSISHNPPTAAISLDDILLTSGETAMVTITFSEPVNGFELSDLSAGSGILSNLIAGADNSYTATFTPTPGINVSGNVISLAAGVYSDLSGSLGEAASSATYEVSTVPVPVIAAITGDDTVTGDESRSGFYLTGTGEPGATVQLAFNSGMVPGAGSSSIVDGSGQWSFSITPSDLVGFGLGAEAVSAFQTLADTGYSSNLAIRSFSVEALNQAPTSITLTNVAASLAENTNTSSRIKVADIAISDDALGTNNISLRGADATFFELDGTALVLKAGTSLDFETKTVYSVTVSVSDSTVSGSSPVSTAYSLDVKDVNEAPTALTLSATTFDENIPDASLVATFNSSDPDGPTQSFTYGFAAGAGDTDNLAFFVSGHGLYITRSPDYERRSSYNFRLKTTDQGGLSFERSLQLAVNDLPDNPSYTFSKSADIVYEGGALSLGVSSSNVAPGTQLYWSFSGADITSADLSDGILSGTRTLGEDGRTSFTKILSSDGNVEGAEGLEVRFFSDSAHTQQLGSTLMVTIKEASVGVITDGPDIITGTAANETISGVPSGSLLRGLGTVDKLTGGGGDDRFALGDATGPYYNDRNPTLQGTTDMAWITDFSVGDKILLPGIAADYQLSSVRYSGFRGVQINALISGSSPEPIGFVQSATLANLNLVDSNQFTYL
jgi:RHS repeat-associated protein